MARGAMRGDDDLKPGLLESVAVAVGVGEGVNHERQNDGTERPQGLKLRPGRRELI